MSSVLNLMLTHSTHSADPKPCVYWTLSGVNAGAPFVYMEFYVICLFGTISKLLHQYFIKYISIEQIP